MFQTLGVKLAKYLLSSGSLTTEDSVILMTVVLDKLGALPYKDIIGLDTEGSLVVRGHPVSLEEVVILRASALAAINNKALNLVCEQILYLAVTSGIHKAETAQQVLWGRVGIWWSQNVKTSLETLAQKKMDL